MKTVYGTTILLLGTACFLVFRSSTLSLIFCYFTLFYFLTAAFIAFTYRNRTEAYLPSCTVLVPAYNEGEFVYRTAASLAASDYPGLRIILIDDGSGDDTAQWIARAQADFPRVEALFSEKNEGKKHALYRGVLRSDSEIIITVDSDSTVAPDAIGNLVKPFADPRIGAVAGNILVGNIQDGLIPRMMDIIFVFCYEFLRSAQSRCGTVLCTPGAMSAYRRTAVLPLLGAWLDQTFLGEKTRIGEDRALTCLLLKNDWKVVYQESARAFTKMPVTYPGTCKMLLRWVRGDIRENILMFPYVFGRISLKNPRSLGLLLHYLAFNAGILTPVVFIPVAITCLIFNFSASLVLATYLLLVTMLWAVVPALVYARKKSPLYALHAFTYGIFVLLFLNWIPLYALLTLKNNRWLTRTPRPRAPALKPRSIHLKKDLPGAA